MSGCGRTLRQFRLQILRILTELLHTLLHAERSFLVLPQRHLGATQTRELTAHRSDAHAYDDETEDGTNEKN